MDAVDNLRTTLRNVVQGFGCEKQGVVAGCTVVLERDGETLRKETVLTRVPRSSAPAPEAGDYNIKLRHPVGLPPRR